MSYGFVTAKVFGVIKRHGKVVDKGQLKVFKSLIFSTSDSSDVLLLSKVRNFGDPLRSAPKSHVISQSQSEAQNGSALGRGSGADPM